jgi:hypothetical protein
MNVLKIVIKNMNIVKNVMINVQKDFYMIIIIIYLINVYVNWINFPIFANYQG